MTIRMPVSARHELSDRIDTMSYEILVARTSADALVVAQSLREIASQCERLAETLHEKPADPVPF